MADWERCQTTVAPSSLPLLCFFVGSEGCRDLSCFQLLVFGWDALARGAPSQSRGSRVRESKRWSVTSSFFLPLSLLSRRLGKLRSSRTDVFAAPRSERSDLCFFFGRRSSRAGKESGAASAPTAVFFFSLIYRMASIPRLLASLRKERARAGKTRDKLQGPQSCGPLIAGFELRNRFPGRSSRGGVV